MTDIQFRLKADDAKKRFLRLAEKLEDLSPIWEKFIPEYRQIISQNFETQGKIMERNTWTALTIPYKRWKMKHFPGKPILICTGKLRQAAENFKTIIKKDNLIMEVEGNAYFAYVQERKNNPRHWFNTPEKELPVIAWNKLTKIANDEIEKEIKE